MKKSFGALLVLSSVLSLSGCVSISPPSFMLSKYSDTKGTTPRVFQSNSPLDVASRCALKNFEERLPAFTAFYSEEPPKPGTKEIRARTEAAGMAAIVELAPTATGTSITVWISNHYPAKGTISERISNGC